MDQTLGKRIVYHRQRLGITQNKLAEYLGVTPQAVSKWENDQACPDITTLPRLAEIFGISIDELLGRVPYSAQTVHEAELIDDDDDGDETHSGHGFEMHWDSGCKSGLGFALWILLTGGLLLASSILDWSAGFWDILWPTGLMVFGLFGLFPDFSFFRLGCGLFGAYFLLDNLEAAPFHLGRELVFPILLVLFGLSLLADALKKPKKPHFTVSHHGKPLYDSRDKKGRFQSHCHMDGERFDCSTVFGEDYRVITLPRLSSGDASLSFGELTVDLTGCGIIADRCHVNASCSFGELKIVVPSTCRVEPATSTAFAAVEFRGTPAPNASTVILMDCSAHFGEIQICYK